MGLYDTMQQAATPLGGMANGTSAQKANPGSQHMRGRGMSPATSGQKNVQNGVQAGFSQPNQMQRANQSIGKSVGNYGMPGGVRPNPTMGQIPGQMGSNSMIQAKQKMMQVGGNMNQPVPYKPQYGMPALQTPYDAQQAQQLQTQQQAPMQSSLAAAQEQMRGYDGPDMGSQDPRELARMQNVNQMVGQPMLQNSPYGGEQPGNPGFQSMMESMGGQRPDVMDRGIGPSNPMDAMQAMGRPYQGASLMNPAQMDENGTELRRGAR